MEILFCRPFSSELADAFEMELEALDALGVPYHRISAEHVVEGYIDLALEGLEVEQGPLLYRGCMLTEEEYELLYDELVARDLYLVTNPSQYAEMHYLPNAYPAIEDLTAPAAWIEGTDLDEAWAAAQSLGPPPYVVKDHVKSAKEDWYRSSWVPEGASRAVFDEVCEAFLEFQGDRFSRGLLFRPLLPLRCLEPSSDYGYPLNDEYRLFFWEGELLLGEPYFEVSGGETDFTRFARLGDRFDSPFFTVDVARLEDGGWVIIEVGDGGVSGLPPLLDPRDFYRKLLAAAK